MILNPSEALKAAQYNENKGYTLRQSFRIFDVVGVTNPWDSVHVSNKIADWQKAQGLNADGKVGNETAEKIAKLL